MQIKEFEAFSLKECLQQVRGELGPDAVILETRKTRKGGLLGLGARDAICVVAATGISVNDNPPRERTEPRREPRAEARTESGPQRSQAAAPSAQAAPAPRPAAHAAAYASAAQSSASAPSASQPAARPTAEERAAQIVAAVAARNAFAGSAQTPAPSRPATSSVVMEREPALREKQEVEPLQSRAIKQPARPAAASEPAAPMAVGDRDRLQTLEQYMNEIKASLAALQRENREGQARTVSAVVSAVGRNGVIDESECPFPDLRDRLIGAGVDRDLAEELLCSLPEMNAWDQEAQLPLAESALRDLIAHRVASAGGIKLIPGKLKAVALVGPTGVGKTTTIAKLAAYFSLVEGKRVGLLTVDTYRIAAVEQLKTYGHIIDIPIAVAYSQAEILPAVQKFRDYDLLLIDTAGRSHKNLMQVGELRSLLEQAKCEVHLVLSAQMKEKDMLEAAERFATAHVERLIFSKLDETSSYGTLLNVADQAGIPLSYLTTGQKVPEDIEVAEGGRLASLLLHSDPAREAIRA
jgi:flagellar biosynthesis protein FlhF